MAHAAHRPSVDTVLLDHFYQLPMLGDPDAARGPPPVGLAGDPNVRLGALDRPLDPALLAKIITARHRLEPGQSADAGWFEFEHDRGSSSALTDRFEKLEAALRSSPSSDAARRRHPLPVKDAINQRRRSVASR